MSELSDEASETELLNRSLTMWHGEGQAASPQELDIPLDLHTAASIGQYEVVKDSIERGEKDLDQKNRGGWTPLMYASYIGYDTVVRMLLQAGANVNMSTPEGQTPLMLAASCGNECAAAFLLQVAKGLGEPLCGYSALMEAAASGHEIIVQYLLSHGVKVDIRDSTGATARTLAMKYGHMKIVGLIDLHTAPVPKVLRRGTGKYEDLSSSDESYCAPQRQRPARKSRGPSIHEGPHALAKITAVRTGGKNRLHHEQVPPEGYVTFKDDGSSLEGGGLRYRDVISPINDRDVESSSSREENRLKHKVT
ncbi:PREDICTED: ankyrin repeat and SAM domain-containing protein 3, partial [Thamnophis sirtalis]|uniref:Ankyrin repeat and SAM domain-containing protein 3 n=1 Tax=Thamnophis sirtalis TaxID=35019 RepID=A0A6I9XSI5_9SAUR